MLAEGSRDGTAIGGPDILPGVKSEGRDYMQKMQFRVLLLGDEGRTQNGTVRFAGEIRGGNDGGWVGMMNISSVAWDGND